MKVKIKTSLDSKVVETFIDDFKSKLVGFIEDIDVKLMYNSRDELSYTAVIKYEGKEEG